MWRPRKGRLSGWPHSRLRVSDSEAGGANRGVAKFETLPAPGRCLGCWRRPARGTSVPSGWRQHRHSGETPASPRSCLSSCGTRLSEELQKQGFCPLQNSRSSLVEREKKNQFTALLTSLTLRPMIYTVTSDCQMFCQTALYQSLDATIFFLNQK